MKKVIFAAVSLILFSFAILAQTTVSLAGGWRFQADSLAIGEAQHWEANANVLISKIKLPGSTDEIALGNYLPLFKSALGQMPPDDYPKNADYGMLTRSHKYIGVAWYQKEITVTGADKKNYSLYLERVMWRSKVWVDGKLMGEPIDFLSTPHNHTLGILSPGKHTVTVMIDNRLVYPIGTLGHAYCPHMQTMWNGAVGKINLIAAPLLSIASIKTFPSFKNRNIKVEVALNNQSGYTQKAVIKFFVKEKKSGKTTAVKSTTIEVPAGISSKQTTVSLIQQPLPWNEFTPNLYELVTSISYGNQSQQNITVIGFRDIGVADKHFTINGKKILYRNSHEGMFFGKTGYPAMDIAYWKKVLGVYKAHGFNGVRFHSSCPPEAAFTAADELGIFIQAEFFWIDGWMGYKSLIGEKNDTLNKFVRHELHEALNVYGNHPSMLFVSFGNELGGNFDRMGDWIAEEKKHDPRHYYAAGIAHNITVADDFVEYGGKNHQKKILKNSVNAPSSQVINPGKKNKMLIIFT
jgi:beta-galactosidase